MTINLDCYLNNDLSIFNIGEKYSSTDKPILQKIGNI